MGQKKTRNVRRLTELDNENISDEQSRSTSLSVADSNPKEELEYCVAAIRVFKLNMAENIIGIGGILHRAHDLLARPGVGDFCQWVKDQFSFTPQTARNYMRVFTVFGATDCKRLLQSTAAETLYFLGRKSTPPSAIKEVLRLVKKGKNITLDSAKEIVGRHKPKKSEGGTADESEGERETSEGDNSSDTAEDSGAGDEQDTEPRTETEESDGGNSDESEGERETAEGDDASDTAEDYGTGDEQDAEPTTETEQSIDDDFTLETIDDKSYLKHFVGSVRRAIKLWSVSCNEDEFLQFPRVLRALAHELEQG